MGVVRATSGTGRRTPTSPSAWSCTRLRAGPTPLVTSSRLTMASRTAETITPQSIAPSPSYSPPRTRGSTSVYSTPLAGPGCLAGGILAPSHPAVLPFAWHRAARSPSLTTAQTSCGSGAVSSGSSLRERIQPRRRKWRLLMSHPRSPLGQPLSLSKSTSALCSNSTCDRVYPAPPRHPPPIPPPSPLPSPLPSLPPSLPPRSRRPSLMQPPPCRSPRSQFRSRPLSAFASLTL
mmetsp:Transcript_47820/g.107754  ORF Transcript_47820/g.107754 Transcript_47820/m.107754 type:complete len:234 (-) Transcript_47820:505-1206(-)